MKIITCKKSINISFCVVLTILGMLNVAEAAPPDLKITDVKLVSSKQVKGSLYEFTYRALINNAGGSATNVSVSIGATALSIGTIDGELNFGSVNAKQTVYSRDTFTVRYDVNEQFDVSMIAWLYDYKANSLTSLGGIPTMPISDATQDFYNGDVVPVNEFSFHPELGQVARTKLMLVMQDQATVQQINDVLAKTHASITSMLAGSYIFGLRIPDPLDVNRLDAVVAAMTKMPGVQDVLHVLEETPAVLPGNPGLGSDPKLTRLTAIDHHLAIKAHAAWNAYQAFKERAIYAPTMLIRDYFGMGVPNSSLWSFKSLTPSDFEAEATPEEIEKTHGHGYGVASVIGANFGGNLSTSELVTGFYPEGLTLGAQDIFKESGIFVSSDSFLALKIKLKAIVARGHNIVLNISLGYCERDEKTKSTAHCTTDAYRNNITKNSISFRNLFDDILKKRVFLSIAAGNEAYEDFPIAAKYDGPYQNAFLAPALLDSNGKKIYPLFNGLVVGSFNTTRGNKPIQAFEESAFSSRGSQIGAVGEYVSGYTSPKGEAIDWFGTSFAAPEIAGLAAAIWTINPTLSAFDIRTIILNTSQKPVNPTRISPQVANAYAALLALDLPLNPAQAPVRKAILDVTDTKTTGNHAPDGKFTIHDIVVFLKNFDDRERQYANKEYVADYSRFDLNGDGYTGGDHTAAFNLDEAFDWKIPTKDLYTEAQSSNVEGYAIKFNEEKLTDLQILLYYAYSNFFDNQGSNEPRTWLLLPYLDKIGLKLSKVQITWKSAPTGSGHTYPPVITLSGISRLGTCPSESVIFGQGFSRSSICYAMSSTVGTPFPSLWEVHGIKNQYSLIAGEFGTLYFEVSNTGRPSIDTPDQAYGYWVMVNAYSPKGKNKFTPYNESGGDYFDLAFSFTK